MKIAHIAFWVNDLEIMKNFYMKYFDMSCSEKYINEKIQFSSYFLSFKNGAKIEIMHRPDIFIYVGKKGNLNGLTHLAISVESRNKMTQLTERLRKDGFTIESETRITGNGFFESVILDPEKNLIEISE